MKDILIETNKITSTLSISLLKTAHKTDQEVRSKMKGGDSGHCKFMDFLYKRKERSIMAGNVGEICQQNEMSLL